MRGLTVRLLVAAAALGVGASWVADLISGRLRGPLLVLPVASGVGLLVLAGALLVLGLRVRRMRDGDRAVRMDRTWGTTAAALAQAIAAVGALSLGWHALLTLDQLTVAALRSDQGPLWRCAFQVGVGLVLAVVGWIVERFCRIPPEDPEDGSGTEHRRGPLPSAPEGGLASGRPRTRG